MVVAHTKARWQNMHTLNVVSTATDKVLSYDPKTKR